MNKELWLKGTYDYLKNTDFDKVKCQSDIYLDYIMLYEENKKLKSIIKTLVKEYNLEPSEYVENLLEGDNNE